jgi:hypothetical protein
MSEGGVRVSNREIYDLVQNVDRTLVTVEYRLARLEERAKARSARGWSFWMAVLASPVTGAVLAVWGIKSGGGA